MKRHIKLAIMACIVGCLVLAFPGCGKDNNDEPFEAPHNAELVGPEDVDIDSAGGAFVVTYLMWVYNEDDVPLNDIDIHMIFLPLETVSSWAWFYGGYSKKDLIDNDDVDYWDDDNDPHLKTDEHGEARVEVYTPLGFAGTLSIIWDIYSFSLTTSIEVNPEGGQCFDGDDNDDDGYVDAMDPECVSPLGVESVPLCADGLDNDGDGLTDLADPGCTDAADMTETDSSLVCDDGLDNDGDGFIDFSGGDPGCTSPTDNNENGITQCDNGVDDDGDTFIDYPSDPECANPSDDDETL